jgi:hypothetical protein
MISAQSRAHRTLRRMKNFVALSAQDGTEWLGSLPALVGDEHLIGAYQNQIGTAAGAVVITTTRLLVEQHGSWSTINYSDIGDIVLPDEKNSANRLLVREMSGKQTEVPVSGGQGRFRDVFEFGRFLQRVRSDALDARLKRED